MDRSASKITSRGNALWASGSPEVEALIAATSDLALVVDDNGIIRDVRHQGSDESLAQSERWRGRALIDTVTAEARPKIEAMLKEVASHGVSRQRQVNHPSTTGPDLPIAYTLVKLDAAKLSVAIGRDLRVISSLQQRLVEAQQALERDYWQMRHIETRYRLLFQLSSEAVVVVEVGSLKVVDANPAAGKVFGVAANKLTGWSFGNALAAKSVEALDDHLTVVRAQGEARDVKVRLRDGQTALTLRAALMPQDRGARYLIQVVSSGSNDSGNGQSTGQASDLISVVENHPDGFALIDADNKIQFANRAFLDLAQLATPEQVRGQLLGQWLGRPGADVDSLVALLRDHRSIRLFATALRGGLGAVSEVEVSGVRVPGKRTDLIGLVVRDVGRRLAAGPQGARDLTLAVEQLTSLVGRVSLRDLVRDTTTLVERHFIEAALELAEHNRTSAAEILGVSRQSLYVKLRRYGDTGPAAAKKNSAAGSIPSKPKRKNRK